MSAKIINLQSARLQKKVHEVHQMLWNDSLGFRLSNPDFNKIEVINPARALELYGYSVDTEIIGMGDRFKVAGILDKASKKVKISNEFGLDMQRFTLAHELGHVVLHPHLDRLHRDVPLEKSLLDKDPVEREANRFAAYVLMPEILLREEFEKIFGLAPFSLNEKTAYALCVCGLDDVQKKLRLKCPRSLTLYLAKATNYNFKNFTSLKDRFGVSAIAMAIRLEELKLVA